MKRHIMARFWLDDNPLSAGDFKTRSGRKIAKLTLLRTYGRFQVTRGPVFSHLGLFYWSISDFDGISRGCYGTTNKTVVLALWLGSFYRRGDVARDFHVFLGDP